MDKIPLKVFLLDRLPGEPWASLSRKYIAKGWQRAWSGYDPATTNNRMELMAAIQALETMNRPCHVELHTDSQYLRQGITEWLPGWKARGWRTAAKAPVKNEDLWRRLDEARLRHTVSWHWVKGHAGHPLNERADALAREGLKACRSAG